MLTRYLDMATGECGSAIQTRLSGADDDDELEVDFFTALRVWHTAQATGPLEGYIAFEFNNVDLLGQRQRRMGLLRRNFSQFARASLRVIDTDGPIDSRKAESSTSSTPTGAAAPHGTTSSRCRATSTGITSGPKRRSRRAARCCWKPACAT